MAYIVIVSAGEAPANSTVTRLTDRAFGPFETWALADGFLQACGSPAYIYPLCDPTTFQKEEDQ